MYATQSADRTSVMTTAVPAARAVGARKVHGTGDAAVVALDGVTTSATDESETENLDA
jgi:hypothetical protein